MKAIRLGQTAIIRRLKHKQVKPIQNANFPPRFNGFCMPVNGNSSDLDENTLLVGVFFYHNGKYITRLFQSSCSLHSSRKSNSSIASLSDI